MSTRSLIVLQIEENKFKGIYCHHDGDPGYNGKILKNHYQNRAKIEKLLDLGDLERLGIEIDNKKNPRHNNKHLTLAFRRDRGNDNASYYKMFSSIKIIEKYANEYWTEYIYLYTLDNEWVYKSLSPDKEWEKIADCNLI